MGSFVIVMFVGVLDMFGWLLMGLFGVIFFFGLFEVWIIVGLFIGVYLNYCVVVGCLCIFIEKYSNVLMLLEFFV